VQYLYSVALGEWNRTILVQEEVPLLLQEEELLLVGEEDLPIAEVSSSCTRKEILF